MIDCFEVMAEPNRRKIPRIAPKVIEEYLSAWSQTDPALRAATLAACVSNDVRFRDRYGAIDDRGNLNGYIAGVQKMMGPARIVPEGPLDRVQNFFRQRWLVEGPDRKAAFRGQNIYEFDAHARLTLIVGFWD